LAQHDFLTGLPNRMLLNDRLVQAMASAHRHHKALAVLFVDVDRFKQINDTLGHAIGDELLKSIAKRLVACLRSSDTVSRYGGDEFIVLLSEVARTEDAALSAHKILAALSRAHRVEHQELYVTVSVGISVFPDDGTDAEILLKNADTALLNAKARGRGNHQFFQPGMHSRGGRASA
jgi:diguanylate cyclase (GGDEF)-like protein